MFDTKQLQAMLALERRSFFYVHLHLHDVHYFMGRKPLAPRFPELIEHSKRVVETAISGSKDFSTESLFLPFVMSATATKHRGFHEEREVRIVAMPGTRFADEQIKDMEGYTPML